MARQQHNHTRFGTVLSLVLALILSGAMTAGCSGGPATTNTTAGPTPAVSTTAQPTPAPTTTATTATTTTAATTTIATTAAGPLNPLTGEPLVDPQAEGKRPIAVMINNIKVATPQIGVGAADLLYEMPVEGGITRLMAVFADAGAIPELGSIRSARNGYIDLAGGLDAIYVHFGGSYLAVEQLEQQKTNDIDLIVTPDAYWRDPVWREQRGLEHSVKTTGQRLQAAIARIGYRTELRKGQKAAFLFRAADQFLPAGSDSPDAPGFAAASIAAEYSNYCTATFAYDANTRLYSKGEYGKPHIDLATGQALQFDNVFILQAKISLVAGTKLKSIVLDQGRGYYISGGQAQKITWRKGQTKDSFTFADEGGSELQVNAGKSYIGVIASLDSVTIH
jgi:hypothetical protein